MKYKIVFLGLSLFLYGIALALPCLLFNVFPIDSVDGSLSDPSNVYAMRGGRTDFLWHHWTAFSANSRDWMVR